MQYTQTYLQPLIHLSPNSELSETTVNSTEPEPTVTVVTSTPSSSTDGWAEVLDEDSANSQDEDTEEPVRTEVLRYLKEKRADMKTDPLDHWKVKQHEYPKLANMARRYLSAPPGSVASERLFSTGKNVLGTVPGFPSLLQTWRQTFFSNTTYVRWAIKRISQ